MPALVTSNFELLRQANSIRTQLNSGCFVQLFQNPYVPTSASLLVNFVRSNFPGYAPAVLDGLFGVPVKVADGFYGVTSSEVLFPVTADDPQLIHGYYVISTAGVPF